MVEHDEVFGEVSGYDESKGRNQRKEQSGPHAQGRRKDPSHPGFGGSHEDEKAGSKDQAYPADGQGLQEKDLHILHMGDFTFIEELPLFPSHAASEIIHHFIRHMEKIVHGHGRQAVQHIVFGVFLFKITGRPVYHCLHGSDEKNNHQAKCGYDSGGSV